MKILRIFPIAAAACFLASISNAETFSCVLKDTRNSGWLPDTLVFETNSDETMAKTYDPITYSTLGDFADARVQAGNSVRVDLKWVTGRYQNDKQVASRDYPNAVPTKIEYRATLLRGGNKILLRAHPVGIASQFSAKGACQVVNGDIRGVVKP
jgi:hypothetical protein